MNIKILLSISILFLGGLVFATPASATGIKNCAHPEDCGGGVSDIDDLTGQDSWDSAVTKKTLDIVLDGIELDLETGAAKGYIRLSNETVCPAADCNEASEAGRLCHDTNEPADEKLRICLGTGGWERVGGTGGGGGDVTDVLGCAGPDCNTITLGATDLLDMSGSDSSTLTEGLILPQHATACAVGFAEGQVCWEADATPRLMIGNAASFEAFLPIAQWNTEALFEGVAFAVLTPGEVDTAAIDDVSVTQDELEELETIGATVLSAANWTALSNLTGTNSGDTVDFPDINYVNENVAADVALAVDECFLVADAGGLFGGIVCEGSIADANEQVYTFPDVNGADTEQEFIFDDSAFGGDISGTISTTQVDDVQSATSNTESVGNSTTQVATTAFVQAETAASGEISGTLGGGFTIDSGVVDTDNITNDTIIEEDLDADNAPVEGDFLQFDATGNDFKWRDKGEVAADLDLEIGTDVLAQDADLDTIAALDGSTNDNVMIVAGGGWSSIAQPAIDCTNCTSIPGGTTHANTLNWSGAPVIDHGATFSWGISDEVTVTHSFTNTGTQVDIAYSTAAMAVTGALTATNLSGTNTGDEALSTSGVGLSVSDHAVDLDVTPTVANATLEQADNALKVKFDATDFADAAAGLELGANPTMGVTGLTGTLPGALNFTALMVDAGSLAADSVDAGDLSATLTMGATDVINFDAWENTDGNGLIGPTADTSCANVVTEGQFCWEEDAELLWVGDGTGAPTNINAGGGGTVDSIQGDGDVATTGAVLSIDGGTGITTAVSGDILTITGHVATADQNLWLTMNADSGTVNANIVNDAFTITGGAGIDTSITADTITIKTLSSEANFLTSAVLSCSGGTQGKIQTHTSALQYCDNTATPVLRHAAYGDSTGDALAGDTAASFFDAGEIEVARGGTGAATFTDGGVMFGSGTSAMTVSAVLTNGQMLIGDGATDPAVGTITGEAGGEITVSVGAGTLELDVGANTLDHTELAATITMAATDVINFDAWDNTDANGLIIPTVDTAACTNVLTEGQICWEEDAETLWVGDGTGGPTAINASGGTHPIAGGDYVAQSIDGNDIATSLGGVGLTMNVAGDPDVLDVNFATVGEAQTGTSTILTVNPDTLNSATIGEDGLIPDSGTLTECVGLMAGGATLPATGGPASAVIDGTNFDYTSLAFDDTTDETAFWTYTLPKNIASTTATVEISWTAAACTATTADDVCWQINGGGFQDSDVFKTGALSGTATAGQSICATADDYEFGTTITWTHGYDVVSPKDTMATFVLNRDADLADAACSGDNNDVSGDAQLIGVQICYEVTHVASGEGA